MKIPVLLILLLAVFSQSAQAQANRITVTVVGNGNVSSDIEGTPGISSHVGAPRNVCTDAAQNIYFTDAGSNRIRKLSAKNGRVTTIAGGGTSTADGVPATSASLSFLSGLCTDLTGNLYLFSGGVVRKVDAVTGLITTLPGLTGSILCSDNAGNIYIGEATKIKKIDAGTGVVTTIAGTGASGYSGDGGPATAAEIAIPLSYGTVISANAAGDVFFYNGTGGDKIRKVNAATGIISTIAGGGGTLFGVLALDADVATVSGMCTDQTGDIYFNEISCSCRKINMANDSVYIAGGNYAVEDYRDDTNSVYAWMNNPKGICTDNAENIYVADYNNNRIRKLIQLTHVPTFALGRGQFINPCTGTSFAINRQMSITDIDFGQLETWTVLSAPTNGTLAGFPYTKMSHGTDSLVLPVGLSYNPAMGFDGDDSFSIKVTDGVYSDTVTLYVTVAAPPAHGVISGSLLLHEMCSYTVSVPCSDTRVDGRWTMANGYDSITDTTGVLTISSLGIDTILYTTNNRCTIVDTYSFSIVSYASPGVVVGSDSLCSGTSTTLTDTAGGGSWSASNSSVDISPAGFATAMSAGRDTIYYNVANACGVSTASKVLTIEASPVSGTITGANEVCETVTIDLADTVTWGAWSAVNGHATVAAGVVAGISAGVDTIVYTVSNSCGSVATTVIVTVDPLPHVSQVLGDTVVCINSTVLLTDTTVGGLWTQTNPHCMITGPGSFFGLSVGTDTVLYSINNMCGSAGAFKTIHVIDCNKVGITNAEQLADITIFPNPASSVLNISWANWQPVNTIIIQDIAGREIAATEWNSNNGTTAQVNVDSLTPGIYFVKINGAVLRKFVKE